jgi:hypothetical protein
MSFFADGLNHGSSDPWFVCEKLIEAADTLDTWVATCGIQDLSIAYDIVGNNHTARASKFEGPGEVSGVILLVCVDEDEIKWAAAFGCELRQCIERWAHPYFDSFGQTGTSNVGASDLSMFFTGL